MMSKDPIMDKMQKKLKILKEAGMSEKEKTIKEEMEERKDIEIKITLTENGYKIETSVPLVPEFVMSTLDSVRQDMFIQHIYAREDAPWMRKLGISRKKN